MTRDGNKLGSGGGSRSPAGKEARRSKSREAVQGSTFLNLADTSSLRS